MKSFNPEIAELIRSVSGLVLASFSPQHVDRLVGFLRATKRAGRQFVVDAYAAFVMHLIASETSIPGPESAEWVKIFFPKFFKESPRKKQVEGIFTLTVPTIGMDEILSNPSRYVMIFRPSMLESDFGGTLPGGTRCLYSRCTGYVNQPEWQHVRAVLAQASGDLIEAHTSGHIFYSDIRELVGMIHAKTVIPIHTFEPEKFHQVSSRVKLLSDGETFIL